MTRGTYAAFFHALGIRESADEAHPDGNYAAVNTLNFIGKYQMGEAALVDIGVVNLDGDAFDNNYSGGFTGKFGLDSVADFLHSPGGQDQAIRAYMAVQFGYLNIPGVDALKYDGQIVDGVKITVSSLLAVAHLVGFGEAGQYVNSGGDVDPIDAYGTHSSEYAALFSDYATPFQVDHAIAEALNGGTHADFLQGRGGDDHLAGKGGADRLSGGAGDDRLTGGFGRDRLTGGGGDDTFIFAKAGAAGRGSTADTIADFASGDMIDLHLMDANGLKAGNQAFKFMAAAGFTGLGQLRFEDGIVYGNTTSAAGAEFAIHVNGDLVKGDFIL
ncbi:hypothetical protein BH10PSE7_BH10PSE7_43980 [soil metagenome]